MYFFASRLDIGHNQCHAKGAGPDGAILGADKLADIKEPKEGDGRTRYCYANTT